MSVPLNERIYQAIKKAGKAGITKKELNEIFSNHSASSIAGILHGMKVEGRIKAMQRGRYCVTENNTFAAQTNIKRMIAKDLMAIQEKYDLRMSEFESLPKTQRDQIREAKSIIRKSINDLIN